MEPRLTDFGHLLPGAEGTQAGRRRVIPNGHQVRDGPPSRQVIVGRYTRSEKRNEQAL
jgi:hypothetical protein